MSKLSRLWTVCCLIPATLFRCGTADNVRRAEESITARDLQHHTQFLESEAFEGLKLFSKGERKTVQYITNTFERMNMEGGKEQPNKLWLEDVTTSQFGDAVVVTAVGYFQRPDGSQQRGPVTIVYVQQGDEYSIAHMNFSNYRDEKEQT
ncbi:MAG: hypothetical protein ABIL68_12610 [bacterium]